MTGAPAYLESSKESNVGYYETFGFAVTREIRIPGGPALWPMWRPPRRDQRPPHPHQRPPHPRQEPPHPRQEE
jgi:hypothetical protein